MHATPRRRFRPRWMWPVLAVMVVAGLTAGLIRLQESACAAVAPRPDPSRVRHGVAIHHRDWSVVRCSYGPLPANGRYASLPPVDYGNAALCGSYLDVTGPRGTVRVQIVDRCQGCRGGWLDLSEGAFADIAGDLGSGAVPVRYRPVRDPMMAGRLAFQVKPGSSADWLAVLALGHGNPLARMDLRPVGGGAWRSLRRGADNYWTVSGAGRGPFQMRVTDGYGHQATVTRLNLSPGAMQRTGTALYGGPGGGPSGTPLVSRSTMARPQARPEVPSPVPLSRATPSGPPGARCR